jgi:DNA-binding PadR family transcriptional regulator
MAPVRTDAPLTSTSYAILGLLAIRPWTTYELAKQMDRAMGAFWPRAESKLYEEPKKLVAHGLAKSTEELVGRRPRTVYSITAKGRRAMAAWLPEPAEGPVVEFEGLLKVFFAEHGTKADLLAAIATAHDWVDQRYREGEGISRGYLDGEGPYPERLPWLVLAGAFLQEITDAVDRWAEWAQGTVEAWPDDVRQAAPDLAMLEEMARKGDERLSREPST